MTTTTPPEHALEDFLDRVSIALIDSGVITPYVAHRVKRPATWVGTYGDVWSRLVIDGRVNVYCVARNRLGFPIEYGVEVVPNDTL